MLNFETDRQWDFRMLFPKHHESRFAVPVGSEATPGTPEGSSFRLVHMPTYRTGATDLAAYHPRPKSEAFSAGCFVTFFLSLDKKGRLKNRPFVFLFFKPALASEKRLSLCHLPQHQNQPLSVIM